MKEATLKSHVRVWLKSIGAWYYQPVSAGFGKHGVPDFLCMFRGIAFAIETKTTGKKPTRLQEEEMESMRSAGWITFVIDSKEGLDIVKIVIESVTEESSDGSRTDVS